MNLKNSLLCQTLSLVFTILVLVLPVRAEQVPKLSQATTISAYWTVIHESNGTITNFDSLQLPFSVNVPLGLLPLKNKVLIVNDLNSRTIQLHLYFNPVESDRLKKFFVTTPIRRVIHGKSLELTKPHPYLLPPNYLGNWQYAESWKNLTKKVSCLCFPQTGKTNKLPSDTLNVTAMIDAENSSESPVRESDRLLEILILVRDR